MNATSSFRKLNHVQTQKRQFKKMKIPAAAVNGDTWSPSLSKVLVMFATRGGSHLETH